MQAECGRQLFEQLFEDTGGGNGGWHHGKESVSAILRSRSRYFLHCCLRHPEKRISDQQAITVGPYPAAELYNVGKEHGAIFAVQRLPQVSGSVVTAWRFGEGPVGRLRLGIASVAVSSFRCLGSPFVELGLHQPQDPSVGTDEGSEIPGLHHQSPDHFERDDRSRTDAHLESPPFADELAQTAYGQHAFAAIFVDADLSPAT